MNYENENRHSDAWWQSYCEQAVADALEQERRERPPSGRPILSDEEVERAAREYLLHRGEHPSRTLRGGSELWETHAPAIRAALTAAFSPPPEPVPSSPVPVEAVGWQPIDTAPMDGTEIILGVEGQLVMVGEYHDGMGRFTSWLTNTGLVHATHWMPLPAAPAHREVGE